VSGHPVTISPTEGRVTLDNGLVQATVDPAQGGVLTHLAAAGGPELLSAPGDDITYLQDTGDIYGAHFGAEQARESQVPAQLTTLAEGPLLARVQLTFALAGQPLTKTVTLRADSPVVELAVEIRAIPETTAVVHTPLALTTATRTDDLGFAAFQHPVDNRPIQPGDITYRREIFYPITYWSDVSDTGTGLTLISHGLQGVGGTSNLTFMLVRQVSDRGQEGVSDPETHTLRYGYLPHLGTAATAQPWLAAYAFNQPLIPVWRTGDQIQVQLPFGVSTANRFPLDPNARPFPTPFSLLSASSALIADVYRQDGSLQALVLDYDPGTPVTIRAGNKENALPEGPIAIIPIEGK
jgi:hypothetical protein